MAKKKKSQELDEKKPEENKVLTFNDLSPEQKVAAKNAILEEERLTNIKPSNPDSPHVQPILQVETEGAGEPNYVETYHWVRFQPRSSPNDEVMVKLTVNGECLLIQRGSRVPLPHRFLECADHTTHNEYAQEPGETRKIVTEVTTFPYELIGDATLEEFERFKKEGTQSTKDRLVKEGTISERESREMN
jgi:hypothetical protein